MPQFDVSLMELVPNEHMSSSGPVQVNDPEPFSLDISGPYKGDKDRKKTQCGVRRPAVPIYFLYFPIQLVQV